MLPASYLPAQARIAEEGRQALRDAATHPLLQHGLARARIASVHHRARRGALTRAARRGSREHAGRS